MESSCVCAICGHSENLLEFSERTFISFHYARERWKLLSTPQGALCRASFERLPVVNEDEKHYFYHKSCYQLIIIINMYFTLVWFYTKHYKLFINYS